MAALQATLTLVGTSATGLFAGSALYITAVQHPAFLVSDTTNTFRAAFFKEMLARAAPMQASLATIGGVTAVAVGLLQRQEQPREDAATLWVASGLAMVAILPFTIATIIPINKQLVDKAYYSKQSDQWMTDSFRRWGQLHSVRTGVSVVAFGVMVAALSSSVAAKMKA